MSSMIEKHHEPLSRLHEHLIKLWCSIERIFKNIMINSQAKSSGFKFSIFDSVEFLSAEIWNSINSENNIFLSTDYLRALEKAPPKSMTFKYAILYEENKPVAIAYFQIITLDARLHESLIVNETDNQEKLSDKVHAKIKENFSSKMLICGNALLSGEHGFAVVQGVDQARISEGISEAIERIRYAEKYNSNINVVLIKDFSIEKKSNNAFFADAGYYDYFAGPNMVVPIRENWESFQDYLADMKAT